MIPIRDNLHRRRFPLITFLLITGNILLFLYQSTLPRRELEAFFYQFGLVPAFISEPILALRLSVFSGLIQPFFTSMFLHANWGHLLGNMWALWIFGDNVEDELGPVRFLLFYLLSGLGAGILHFFTNIHSIIPTIGASGAIAGIMGAFMLFFPRAKIVTIVPIIFFFTLVNIPAFIYLGIWFFSQLYFGALTFGMGSAGGIAWWAHVGGFLFGIFILPLFRRHRYGG